MTPFVIALIAAPFVFWLFRRQSVRRLREDHQGKRQGPDGTIVEPTVRAPPRIEDTARPPENSGAATTIETPAPEVRQGGAASPVHSEAEPAEVASPFEPVPVPADAPVPTAAISPKAEATTAVAARAIASSVDSAKNADGLSAAPKAVGHEAQDHSAEEAISEPDSPAPIPPANGVPAPTVAEIQDDERTAAGRETNDGASDPLAAAPEGAAEDVSTNIPIAPHLDVEIAATVPEDKAVPDEDLRFDLPEGEQDIVEHAAAPGRYRPPAQGVQRAPIPRSARSTRAARAETALEIRVRLTLDRFGFCQISLLPERTGDMDDEVTVKAGGQRVDLVSQEEWYSDVRFDNIGEYLQHGLRLTGILANHHRVQWQLKGRDFYVLAGHPSASGFVSVSRLVLGRSHVVICIASLQHQVEALLKEAGCHGYARARPFAWLAAGMDRDARGNAINCNSIRRRG